MPPCLPPQQKQGVFLSRASSISLTVEHALESFSFLNTSDMEDSEGSEEEPLQDERCTAGLAGWGCGAGCGPRVVGMGDAQLFPGAQAHSDWPITPQGRSRSQSSRMWPFWWHNATPHLSMGAGLGGSPRTLCPQDLLLHPALMP